MASRARQHEDSKPRPVHGPSGLTNPRSRISHERLQECIHSCMKKPVGNEAKVRAGQRCLKQARVASQRASRRANSEAGVHAFRPHRKQANVHAFSPYRRPARMQAGVPASLHACMRGCIMGTKERRQEYSSVLPANPWAADPAQTPVQSSCQLAVLQSFIHECMQEGSQVGPEDAGSARESASDPGGGGAWSACAWH